MLVVSVLVQQDMLVCVWGVGEWGGLAPYIPSLTRRLHAAKMNHSPHHVHQRVLQRTAQGMIIGYCYVQGLLNRLQLSSQDLVRWATVDDLVCASGSTPLPLGDQGSLHGN